MAKKSTPIKSPQVEPFIVALLVNYKLIDERAQMFDSGIKPGETLSVNAQSTFEVEVGIGTGDDRERMFIVLTAQFFVSRANKEAIPVAEVTSKHVFNYKITRIIGEIGANAIPMAAIHPYTQMAAIALMARARELFNRMGLAGIPLKVPDNFGESALAGREISKK